MVDGAGGPSRSLSYDSKGSVGVAIAFVMASLVMVTAIVVANAAPATTDDTSPEPVQDAETVQKNIDTSFENANKRATTLTDWSSSSSASGYSSSGPPVRRFVSDSTWNNLDAPGRQALQTEMGATVQTMKSHYANTGQSATIEPTGSGYETETRVTYYGWLNQTGDDVTLAGDIDEVRDFYLKINRDSLNNSEDGAMKILVEDGDGGNYHLELYHDDDNIEITDSDGLSRTVNNDEVEINFTSGTINGNDAPIDFTSDMDAQKVSIRNASEGLGMVEFMATGPIITDVSSQSGNVDADSNPEPWVRVTDDLVHKANLEITIRGDGTTYTDQTTFTSSQTATRACRLSNHPDELPCEEVGDVYDEPEPPAGPGPGSPGPGPTSVSTSGSSSESNCKEPNDNYICSPDSVAAKGNGEYRLTDTSNDGQLSIGSAELSDSQVQQIAQNNDDVSIDGAIGEGSYSMEFDNKDAYKEVTGTESLNPSNDVTWEPTDVQTVDESDVVNGGSGGSDGYGGSGGSSSGGNNDSGIVNTISDAAQSLLNGNLGGGSDDGDESDDSGGGGSIPNPLF